MNSLVIVKLRHVKCRMQTLEWTLIAFYEESMEKMTLCLHSYLLPFHFPCYETLTSIFPKLSLPNTQTFLVLDLSFSKRGKASGNKKKKAKVNKLGILDCAMPGSQFSWTLHQQTPDLRVHNVVSFQLWKSIYRQLWKPNINYSCTLTENKISCGLNLLHTWGFLFEYNKNEALP